MKTNITLIGMPGAGKSTVGIILAKMLSFGFIDTDILIQINNQMSLQQILDQKGYKSLRKIEETEILKLNVQNHIIATGGSAVYSEKAMNHLNEISRIVFLDADFDTITKRVQNFKTRGIARSKNQTIEDVFVEREILYRKYAEYTIYASYKNQDETAEAIISILS